MPRRDPDTYDGVFVELAEIFTIDEKLDRIASLLSELVDESGYAQPPQGDRTGDLAQPHSTFFEDIEDDISTIRMLLQADYFRSKPFELKDKTISSMDNPYRIDFTEENVLNGAARFVKIRSSKPFVLHRRIDRQWFEHPWTVDKYNDYIINETVEVIKMDFEDTPANIKLSASQIPESLRR